MSQVFTELQSFVAENNSRDRCFLKYGFEIYIRVARFGVLSPDFLACSIWGWASQEPASLTSTILLSTDSALLWLSSVKFDAFYREGNGPWASSPHCVASASSVGTEHLCHTESFPKESSTFTLATSASNGKKLPGCFCFFSVQNVGRGPAQTRIHFSSGQQNPCHRDDVRAAFHACKAQGKQLLPTCRR